MPQFVWYIAGGILLLSILAYFLQEKLIFKPEKLKADFEFKYDAPFREYFFDIAPGVRINGLHFYRDQPKGLILYFHGNTRSIKGWARYARDFYRYDYDVVLLDYRGFGKSTGKRSEKEMLGDMQFIYERLKEKYGEDHLIVAIRRSNLGSVLRRMGHLAEAIHLQQQVLVAETKTLGEDHPTVAISRLNLAFTLRDLGDAEAAATQAREALRVARLQPEGSQVRVGVESKAPAFLGPKAP